MGWYDGCHHDAELGSEVHFEPVPDSAWQLLLLLPLLLPQHPLLPQLPLLPGLLLRLPQGWS